MKRPPRQVWLMLADGESWSFPTKKAADQCALVNATQYDSIVVAGPYVLAERVRQK